MSRRNYEEPFDMAGFLKLAAAIAFIVALLYFGWLADGWRAERWARAMREQGVHDVNLPPGGGK